MTAQAEGVGGVDGRASGLLPGCRAWLRLGHGDGGQPDAGPAWAGLDPSLHSSLLLGLVAAGRRLADEFVREFDVGAWGRLLFHSVALKFTRINQ